MSYIQLENMIKVPDEVTACILCGEDVIALKEPVEAVCDFCGKKARTSVQCAAGHYICDSCRTMPVVEFVKSVCLKYKATDPIALAVEIMNSPVIKMHGPEHHFIVPAVLLTCLHNSMGGGEGLAEKLATARERAKVETPQNCTYRAGSCGAAIGTGVFMSMFLGRDEADEDAWSLSNRIIAASLMNVAESGGPRCCKRDTYLALQSAVAFLNEKFALNLPTSEAKCTFSLRNRTCAREDCSFYNMANSLV